MGRVPSPLALPLRPSMESAPSYKPYLDSRYVLPRVERHRSIAAL